MADRYSGTSPRPMRESMGWAVWMRAALGGSDLLVATFAVAVAHGVRFGFDSDATLTGGPWSPSYMFMSALIALGWWWALGIGGSRDATVLGHGPQELQRLVSASWRVFAVVAMIAFATQWQISRFYLLVALPVGVMGLFVTRGLWRLWIHAQRDKGYLQANVLIVGAESSVRELEVRFRGGRRAGFRVVGVASVPGHTEDWSGLDPRITRLGSLDDPLAQATSVRAEYIVVAGTEAMSFEESHKLGWALEGSDIGLLIAPSLADVAGPRVHVTPVAGLPLLEVTAPTFVGVRYAVKAVLDRLGALALLVLAALPMIAIAIAIRAGSPGPVFFVQERVGLGMKPFPMLKFRSMYADAEERLEDLLEHDEGAGALFKMKNDPRITPVGRLLRRFSLDELPQLLNVLLGHMSLVGPRPPLAREVEQWEDNVERRQLVKPGLTGLWQVSGRSDLSWEESVRLDLYYAENWSLGGDLVIILRTIYTVLRQSGAY